MISKACTLAECLVVQKDKRSINFSHLLCPVQDLACGLHHSTPDPHARPASRPRARSPLVRGLSATATSTSSSLLCIRGSTHTSQTEISNPTHDIAAYRIDSSPWTAQRWPLCSHALDAEELDARSVPDAYGAFLNLHLGREDEGPEQGFVPAEAERRPFEILDADG